MIDRGAAILLGLGSLLTTLTAAAQARAADPPPLADYFRAEVARIEARPLAGIASADAWRAARPELQRKLRGMLGLDPWPGRTPLKASITGTVDRPDFVVETLVFQSSPGLYVSANLYRPKEVRTPLPAILYVCGHSRVEKDGVILGAKTHYQHHAAWYASNGYVCLVLDTLQLGELPGLHHGTNRFGMWWWSARGYTPAGVEAWNAVRGVDYLQSRPEVDGSKIGMTGRSGGGATTWWAAAIDDRIKVAVPVAGITDLRNHVVDGVVQGHCDCMYHVNTERWDFDVIAALIAPRPMLIENTDNDPIFPEDGVRRIFERVKMVYGWLGASDRLGLVVGKGGHVDSPEIRHPSFAFMDKHLKGVDRPIVEPDRHIPDERLRVLPTNEPPADNINPVVHERFRPATPPPVLLRSGPEWEILRKDYRGALAERTFAGWPGPDEAGSLDVRPESDRTADAVRIRSYGYASQPGVRLRFWTIERGRGDPRSTTTRFLVVDDADWRATWRPILAPTDVPSRPIGAGDGTPAWVEARDRVLKGTTLVVIAPRGVGPSAWPTEKETHIRRRFMLLGQTLDGMRVWDVRRGIAAGERVAPHPATVPTFAARGDAASWLLWALATSDDHPGTVELTAPPTSVRAGPAYLNLELILDMPQAVGLLAPRPVLLRETPAAAWGWTRTVGAVIGRPGWPAFE